MIERRDEMRLALAEAQGESPQAFPLPGMPEPARRRVWVPPVPAMADVMVGPAVARL